MMFIWISMFVPIAGGLVCTPTITVGSNSKPDAGGFIFIECEISTCIDVTLITYDKTGIASTGNWTSVYEGSNKTYYHALDTGTNYTLENRNFYTAFPTKHILNIQPVLLQDHGQWRCIVNDENIVYKSKPMDVVVYVIPGEDSIVIDPSNPSLVSDQTQQFSCVLDGIHPQPSVVWTLNGIYINDGIMDSNKQRADGLWLANSTIQIAFNLVGVNVLHCILKTDTYDPWLNNYISIMKTSKHDGMLQSHIRIDVKPSAKILYPQQQINITTKEDAAFPLKCSGTGYKPTIMWMKNGHTIDINSTYNVSQSCDNTVCVSSVNPIVDIEMPCFDTDYTGIYTCVVSLEPPYTSTVLSPNFNVYEFDNSCSRKSWITLIIIIVSSGLLMALTCFAVVLCWYKGRKGKGKCWIICCTTSTSCTNNCCHCCRQSESAISSIKNACEMRTYNESQKPVEKNSDEHSVIPTNGANSMTENKTYHSDNNTDEMRELKNIGNHCSKQDIEIPRKHEGYLETTHDRQHETEAQNEFVSKNGSNESVDKCRSHDKCYSKTNRASESPLNSCEEYQQKLAKDESNNEQGNICISNQPFKEYQNFAYIGTPIIPIKDLHSEKDEYKGEIQYLLLQSTPSSDTLVVVDTNDDCNLPRSGNRYKHKLSLLPPLTSSTGNIQQELAPLMRHCNTF